VPVAPQKNLHSAPIHNQVPPTNAPEPLAHFGVTIFAFPLPALLKGRNTH